MGDELEDDIFVHQESEVKKRMNSKEEDELEPAKPDPISDAANRQQSEHSYIGDHYSDHKEDQEEKIEYYNEYVMIPTWTPIGLFNYIVFFPVNLLLCFLFWGFHKPEK